MISTNNSTSKYPKTQAINLRSNFADAAAEIAAIEGVKNLNAALIYAAHGIPVFPCDPTPGDRAKRPLTPHGFKDASTDEARISAFWNRRPDALIGVPTGPPSGVFVVDVDYRADGSKNGWPVFREKLDAVMPDTLRARSGGGGMHFFLRYPGTKLRNSEGRIGAHVDTRGDGGYIIAPPSIHPDARREYRFVNAGTRLADMPGELIDICLARTAPRSTERGRETPPPVIEIPDHRLAGWYASVVQGECRDVAGTQPGGRNHRLLNAAGRCGQVALTCGLDVASAGRELLRAAIGAGLCEAEAVKTIRSGFRYARENGPAKPPMERLRRQA